jgi:hypothetical protein
VEPDAGGKQEGNFVILSLNAAHRFYHHCGLQHWALGRVEWWLSFLETTVRVLRKRISGRDGMRGRLTSRLLYQRPVDKLSSHT